MVKCCQEECEEILIKQYLDGSRPLTEQQQIERKHHKISDRRTLECVSCGGLCYQTIKEAKINDTGQGLCKHCGGRNIMKRPRTVIKLNLIKHMEYGGKIWSCRIHGTEPFDKIWSCIGKEQIDKKQ